MAAKAPKEYSDAADSHLCNDCALDARKVETAKIGPPRPYDFNHTVGVDVFDLHDREGATYLFLNIIEMRTIFR